MLAELAGSIIWTMWTKSLERLKRMSLKRRIYSNAFSEKSACLPLGKGMIGQICCW